MNNIYEVLRKPAITEKSEWVKARDNTYCFEVYPRANKIEIKDAVEKLLKVRVKAVRVMNVKGKKKRVGKHVGITRNRKKAYVTLEKGQTIDFLEGP